MVVGAGLGVWVGARGDAELSIFVNRAVAEDDDPCKGRTKSVAENIIPGGNPFLVDSKIRGKRELIPVATSSLEQKLNTLFQALIVGNPTIEFTSIPAPNPKERKAGFPFCV